MSLHAWANRAWYGKRRPPVALIPLAALFGAIVALRREAYRRGWLHSVALRAPVIVVGNITVGGTGKTPLTWWLAQQLTQRGFRPGIVTRGHGGSEAAPQLIDATSDPAKFGDEPVLMARRAGVPVAVGRDRPAAAQLLIEQGADVILSDDGMQHYALQRDCEIAVIDSERGLGNGWPLPAGPLREPESRLGSVDAVVSNGENSAWPDAIPMHLVGEFVVNVGTGERLPLRSFAGAQVHGVAAIGHPQRFFNSLRAYGLRVIAHAYDDHARLDSRRLEFADALPVLMTEKDAVKCWPGIGSRFWYVPVGVEIAPAAIERLLGTIEAACARARRDRIG